MNNKTNRLEIYISIVFLLTCLFSLVMGSIRLPPLNFKIQDLNLGEAVTEVLLKEQWYNNEKSNGTIDIHECC